jgi:hypothetical protein
MSVDGLKVADPPKEYKVANFGEDSDIMMTTDNLKESEAELGMKLSGNYFKKKDLWPKDYPVPNFGGEKETYMTLDHLSLAEKEYGHKMDVKAMTPAEYPKNFKVPNFGQDEDISGTADSLKTAEVQLNHKLFDDGSSKEDEGSSFVQLNREPLLTNDKSFKTAAPIFQADREDWKKDYYVPSFGREKETYMSLDHIK